VPDNSFDSIDFKVSRYMLGNSTKTSSWWHQVIIAILVWFGHPGFNGIGFPAPAIGGRFSNAPAGTLSKANPYASDKAALLAGEKLYQRRCAECHGRDALGKGKAPSLISPEVQGAAPGALLWFLKRGALRQGMPAWSRLPEQQLWQIISYLKGIQPTPSRNSPAR